MASANTLISLFNNRVTVRVSANFTRPSDTTAYADGDLVANSTTAGSVVALALTNATRLAGRGARIRQVVIRKSGTGITANANFTLHLFDVDPTGTNPAAGDNGAISLTACIDNFIASVSVTMTSIHTDGALGFSLVDIPIRLVSGTTLYGLIECDDAHTPASAEVYTVEIDLVHE